MAAGRRAHQSVVPSGPGETCTSRSLRFLAVAAATWSAAMRVATLRATVVIRAGSIPTTRSAMTASTAAHAVSSSPSQAAVTLAALTVASWPVRTLPSRRGKRPARVAARPTLRPAAHCPTPVARDTSEEVIASTNPTWWWTWTGPRSVSRVSCEPACAIATSCAPSTAFGDALQVTGDLEQLIGWHGRAPAAASRGPNWTAAARNASASARSWLVDIPHHTRTRVRIQGLSTANGAAGQLFSLSQRLGQRGKAGSLRGDGTGFSHPCPRPRRPPDKEPPLERDPEAQRGHGIPSAVTEPAHSASRAGHRPAPKAAVVSTAR